MKSLIISLVLLFFFSLQSCSGGDSDYISIDKDQPNETKKTDTSQNNNLNNEEDNNGEDNNEEEDDKEGEDYEHNENQDSGDQDNGNQNSENQDNGNQNSENQDSENQNSGNQESENQDNGNQDSGDQDSGDQDSGDQESGDQESGNPKNKNNPFSYGPIPTTPIENNNSVKAYLYIDQISTDGIAHQSAACYGDYAFFISNKMINIMVYNMRTNQRIFTLKQDPLGTGTIYHCNQACFGTQKYSEEDPFPLLYISQFQNKSNRCFITVFRILPTSAGADQEYVAFSFERIQTIYFPIASDDNSLNNANAVIDTDHHFIYTYSRNNNSAADNYKKCKISKFYVPNPLESGSVYLSNSDILDSYFIPIEAVNMQGGAIHDGLLYIGKGAPAVGYVYLNVVDLINKKLSYTFDLLNNGYTWEPEGALFYKDELYIGASKRIFKFSFQNENNSAKAIAVPFIMPK